MSEIMLQLKILLLLGVANGAPLLGWRILKNSLAYPLDGGVKFLDGRPLFGPTKTIRGIVLSLAVTVPTAVLLGFSWTLGVLISVFAMLGDLTSSFIKRRRRIPPSSMVFGLDQIPESLFPLLAVMAPVGLTIWEIIILVSTFIVLELLLSRLLFKLHLRNRPY